MTSAQDCFAASSSSLIVFSIWVISAATSGELRSPSAWYLTSMSKASSRRSLLIRKRGDSGTKLHAVSATTIDPAVIVSPTHKIKLICKSEGTICKSEGTLHDQSDGASEVVPKVMPAATIAPMK